MDPLMRTIHKIYTANSGRMDELDTGSVDMVVTSPPYPMITMWDELFSSANPEIGKMLTEDGKRAFELMHRELDKTWTELKRVVKDGGTVCINVGDATRTVNDNFSLYPNHARIVSKMTELGFDVLPGIIWHKQTNSPNKFMGSGMLPAGAYVTLEHEHILIFRKNGKRVFSDLDKELRRESAYFWEERNEWFSDAWNFKGERQRTDKSGMRERSAAFPCELPKRLILMFSQYGDTVLDPFLGTGTTTKAAILFGRNSAGYEIDRSLTDSCKKEIFDYVKRYERINAMRIAEHSDFVNERINSGKEVKHMNHTYNMPVMTSQECAIKLYCPSVVREDTDGHIIAEYSAIGETEPAVKVLSGTDQRTRSKLY